MDIRYVGICLDNEITDKFIMVIFNENILCIS